MLSIKQRSSSFSRSLRCSVPFLSRGVGINYNFADYLPESSPSTTAIRVMDMEFSGGVPNGRIMVTNVTVPEALEIKGELAKIEGMTDVLWLDDYVNVYTPLEVIDSAVRESYYLDGVALYSVTVDKGKLVPALQEARCVVEGHMRAVAMAGEAANTAFATESTEREITMLMLLVIPMCFIILLLTTSSWFEPVLFMVTIGISIMINRGTNLMFGEISFVTNAAGSILQLAVTMDYSIFCCIGLRISGERASTCRKP